MSEFQRPVSLLLVVAASHRLSVIIFVTELYTDLAVVPELMGRSRPKMWYGHGRTGRIGSYAYAILTAMGSDSTASL